jgi:uncharacterized protein
MASRQPVEKARVWQRMLSGRRLDLLDPSPLEIEIEDIAHGLSRLARWNGQTIGARAYSVAQHSLFVEAIALSVEPGLDAQARLTILLHDAAEYVIGDIISPFKAVMASEYKAVEARLLAAIRLRFSLPPEPLRPLAELTKKADRIAAYHEATRLAGFGADEALRLFGSAPLLPQRLLGLVDPLDAEAAKAQFLRRFAELDKGPAGL